MKCILMSTVTWDRFLLFQHEPFPWHGMPGWIHSTFCLSFSSYISTTNVDGWDSLAWTFLEGCFPYFLSTRRFYPINVSGSKGKSCPIVVGSPDLPPSPRDPPRGAGTARSRTGTDTPRPRWVGKGVCLTHGPDAPSEGWVQATRTVPRRVMSEPTAMAAMEVAPADEVEPRTSVSQRMADGLEVARRAARVQSGHAEARGGADPLEGLGMPEDCVPDELPALRAMIAAFSAQQRSCNNMMYVMKKQYEETKRAADRERELAVALSQVDASLGLTGKEDEATRACSRACKGAGETRGCRIQECEKKVIHTLESLCTIAMQDAQRCVQEYEDARVKYALARHAVKRAQQKYKVRPALYMHEKSTREAYECLGEQCKSKLAMCLSKTAVDVSTALRAHVECFAAADANAGNLYTDCKQLMAPMVEASMDRAGYILSVNRPTPTKAIADSDTPPPSIVEQEILD